MDVAEQNDGILSAAVRDCLRRSVLGWLATVDADSQPNVSPKEVFAALDGEQIAIANIASPRSAANVNAQPRVCFSFVDVFVQKGYKLAGTAREILPTADEFATVAEPLLAMTQGRFPIRSVLLVQVVRVEVIQAPSYWLYPETTEAGQIASAMRTYGVQPALEK